jgi:hypothetical protein
MRDLSQKKKSPAQYTILVKKSLKMDNLPGSREKIADFFPVWQIFF